MHEVTIFTGGGVTVTTARVILGAQTIPIGAVSAIMPVYRPKETTGAAVAGVAAVIFAVAPGGLCLLSDGKVFAFGVALLLAGLGMLGIAVAWAATRRAFFGVRIVTSGGAREVYDTSEAFQRGVLTAMNQAMAQR